MSLPSHGTLQINGNDAMVGQTISLSAIQSVIYLSPSDFNGTVTSEINVSDGIATTAQVISMQVLDTNNTLALTTTMLDGQTFYLIGDAEGYLLKTISRLWKFGMEYDDGDKEIELWFTERPDNFPIPE